MNSKWIKSEEEGCPLAPPMNIYSLILRTHYSEWEKVISYQNQIKQKQNYNQWHINSTNYHYHHLFNAYHVPGLYNSKISLIPKHL